MFYAGYGGPSTDEPTPQQRQQGCRQHVCFGPESWICCNMSRFLQMVPSRPIRPAFGLLPLVNVRRQRSGWLDFASDLTEEHSSSAQWVGGNL